LGYSSYIITQIIRTYDPLSPFFVHRQLSRQVRGTKASLPYHTLWKFTNCLINDWFPFLFKKI
jgi:hypothetical protein